MWSDMKHSIDINYQKRTADQKAARFFTTVSRISLLSSINSQFVEKSKKI